MGPRPRGKGMTPRDEKKIKPGTVAPGDTTGSMSDKERAHPGALEEAAEPAKHPEAYGGAAASEARWARDQLNRGPSSDYVGHERQDKDVPDTAIGTPPAGSVPERLRKSDERD